MKFTIEFCMQWNYKPTALRARDRLLVDSKNDVELIEGSGGAFEVTCEGKLIYSKHATNRFPTDEELDAMLRR